MDREELFEFLRENLSINVKSDWDYTGYGESKDYHIIQLLLDGVVISEDTLS